MTKRYTGNYIVKWLDKDDKKHSKVYSDYGLAIKARKWLVEQEAKDIDIAVELT